MIVIKLDLVVLPVLSQRAVRAMSEESIHLSYQRMSHVTLFPLRVNKQLNDYNEQEVIEICIICDEDKLIWD